MMLLTAVRGAAHALPDARDDDDLPLPAARPSRRTRRRSAEGGLKYFVYGSVSSALFLFGLSLLYGLTGTTQLDAIRAGARARPAATRSGLAGNVAGATAVLLMLVGFGFKVAAVPFHQWAPDAYEGAPAPVTAWIATGSKVASFVALMKVLLHALGPWASPPDDVAEPGLDRRRRGALGRDDDLRQLRRAGPAEPQADARLLVDRARRLHARGRRGGGRLDATRGVGRRRSCSTWSSTPSATSGRSPSRPGWPATRGPTRSTTSTAWAASTRSWRSASCC